MGDKPDLPLKNSVANSLISGNVQDKNSIAWKKLCSYADKIAAENSDEFSPLKELGPELFSQIHTLPETISNLKKVTKVWLYGSKLKRIPSHSICISNPFSAIKIRLNLIN
ncbi:hypothetical protein [Chitinophaga oryziterrae]|uniref:hypothetical protein n=1 Tax=Chitinophaga oryziterrae TaxID=1031224 RepID=UPI001478291A|nr:hypothetical protein [Chitinophaga oryziterrae]